MSMSEKIIRDPIHDVIAFRIDDPVERLLFSLLNAAEVQRLRRIRQLGMAHLAYPGADHSRYSHSLGVMQTARRIIEQLRRSFSIDEHEETVCLCASLLHDLGHGRGFVEGLRFIRDIPGHSQDRLQQIQRSIAAARKRLESMTKHNMWGYVPEYTKEVKQ